MVRPRKLDGETMAAVSQLLDRAGESLGSGKRDRGLAKDLESFARRLDEKSGDADTVTRRARLADTLHGIAARLR
ncbi:MAG TPA: hypothetical protein VK854_08505 [Woeseiaceae bacterium]|nr:hypothetical protein [Woeseiaceae bacterium]